MKLQGPDRALDALVGLVILVAALFIGILSLAALYELGMSLPPFSTEQAEAGFALAVFGAGIATVITTIVYLVRVAVGRTSWKATLWGLILSTVAYAIGYAIMSA